MVALLGGLVVQAQSSTPNRFYIIPEESDSETVTEAVRDVSGGEEGTVWDRYNRQADEMR